VYNQYNVSEIEFATIQSEYTWLAVSTECSWMSTFYECLWTTACVSMRLSHRRVGGQLINILSVATSLSLWTCLSMLSLLTSPWTWVSYLNLWVCSRSGVDNSFGFAGHIRDKLDIRGPGHVHVNWFKGVFYDKANILLVLKVFSSVYIAI